MFDLSQPFAVIQKEDQPSVLILRGPVRRLDSLEQIPRRRGREASGRRYDTLSLLPFSQIREKGFEARRGDEALLCMEVQSQEELAVGAFLAGLPPAAVELEGEPAYEQGEEAYREAVRAVIEREIGEGQGANFVLQRTCRAKLKGYSPAVALQLLARLMRADYGTYWKYAFFDGSRCFVGSTPEKHLSVDKGRVAMNPISGTFRKAPQAPPPTQLRSELLAFLRDRKEINELFMVVDEELKMMSRMCEQGGMIVGPLLKEMSRVLHSEYLLVGQSSKDLLELLRDSLFAATVTGSPVENACKIIARYEPQPRRYYASSIALIGRDEEGEPFLDSPILIRSLEIDPDGAVQLRVGATLVRDSQPEAEVQETHSKAAAVLAALRGEPQPQPRLLEPLLKDPLVVECLAERNQRLSTFWFLRQEKGGPAPLKGLRFALIDNEDDFLYMFGHMLEHLGAQVSVTPWKRFDLAAHAGDIVVPGPGPGNPSHLEDPKMALNGRVIDALLQGRRPFLAVCLGHQVLCQRLGLRMGKKAELTQGVQKPIDYFGRPEHVGFYNTFCGYADPSRKDLGFCADARGEIHALRGAHFASFQFHPESILTTNGLAIVEEAARLVSGR